VFALEAQSPNRIMLNVDRAMRTDYVIDDLQPTYFVIESFADLYHQTVDRDFDRLYRSLGAGFTFANSAVHRRRRRAPPRHARNTTCAAAAARTPRRSEA
jgi:phenylalanine-4-hydroxylase